MNRRFAFAVLLLIPAWGQSSDLRPTEPILKRAPANAEWTVEFYSDRDKVQETEGEKGKNAKKGEASGDAVKPARSLTVSKNGNIYREIVLDGEGNKTEKWVVGALQVYGASTGGHIARSILPAGSQFSTNYSDYRRSDFEDLEWVGNENFQGIKEFEGREVFEFRVEAGKRKLTPREITELPETDAPMAAGELQRSLHAGASRGGAFTAYLDARTQLPVFFDDGQVVRLYKFSPQPPGSLVIPEAFRAELETWKNELNRHRALPKP